MSPYKDPEKRRKYNHDYHRHQQVVRQEIIRLLGARCTHCGYDIDVRALQIDHVNGGGLEHKRSCGNYLGMLKNILKEIKAGSKEYQILCANCNVIKRFERNEVRQ